jgi:hypothetical protein
VSALGEYWLRSHEMIERTIQGFTTIVLVRHSDLLTAPKQTFHNLCADIDLPDLSRSLPIALDKNRNDRWRELLDPSEQRELEEFIEIHCERIQRLRFADTTI